MDVVVAVDYYALEGGLDFALAVSSDLLSLGKLEVKFVAALHQTVLKEKFPHVVVVVGEMWGVAVDVVEVFGFLGEDVEERAFVVGVVWVLGREGHGLWWEAGVFIILGSHLVVRGEEEGEGGGWCS